MSREDRLNCWKTDSAPADDRRVEAGGYHIYGYQRFYRNLQENVGARLDAYLAAHAQDTAA